MITADTAVCATVAADSLTPDDLAGRLARRSASQTARNASRRWPAERAAADRRREAKRRSQVESQLMRPKPGASSARASAAMQAVQPSTMMPFTSHCELRTVLDTVP